jgi:hypothetical protein
MHKKKFIFKNILLSFFLILLFIENTVANNKNDFKLITFFDLNYSKTFFYNETNFLNFEKNINKTGIFFFENKSRFLKGNHLKSKIKLKVKIKENNNCLKDKKFDDKIFISKGNDSKLFDLINSKNKLIKKIDISYSKLKKLGEERRKLSDKFNKTSKERRLEIKAKEFVKLLNKIDNTDKFTKEINLFLKDPDRYNFAKTFSMNVNDYQIKQQSNNIDLLKNHALNIKNNLIGFNYSKFVNFYHITKSKKDYILIIKILIPNKLYNVDKIVIDLPKKNLEYFDKINLNFNDSLLKTVDNIKSPIIDFNDLAYQRNKLKKLKHIYIFYKIPSDVIQNNNTLNIKDYLREIEFYKEKKLDYYLSLSKLDHIIENKNIIESIKNLKHQQHDEKLHDYILKLFAIASKEKKIVEITRQESFLRKIKKINSDIEKELNTYFKFTNNSYIYDYDILVHNKIFKKTNKFFVIVKDECLKDISGSIENTFFGYFIKKFNKNEIRLRMQRSLNNALYYIGLNNIEYNFDELHLIGETYQNKLVQKNFFVSYLSKEEFFKIKNHKISVFKEKVDDFVKYDGNVLIDNNNESFKINLLENQIKDKTNLVIFVIIILIIIFNFTYLQKSTIYIKNKNFNKFYYLITSFLTLLLLINMFNSIINQYFIIILIVMLIILLSIKNYEIKK